VKQKRLAQKTKAITYNDVRIFSNIQLNQSWRVPSSEVLKRRGIKIDQYRVIAEKAHSWKNELSDTLSFE
jgi:hypothetical protein